MENKILWFVGRFKRSFELLKKTLEYRKAGWSIISFVSTGDTIVDIADANVVKEITGNRLKFPKPIEQYGVLKIYGEVDNLTGILTPP